jgi:hypothetical protein
MRLGDLAAVPPARLEPRARTASTKHLVRLFMGSMIYMMAFSWS